MISIGINVSCVSKLEAEYKSKKDKKKKKKQDTEETEESMTDDAKKVHCRPWSVIWRLTRSL